MLFGYHLPSSPSRGDGFELHSDRVLNGNHGARLEFEYGEGRT